MKMLCLGGRYAEKVSKMKLSKMKVMEMVEVKKMRSENLDVNMDVINLEELKIIRDYPRLIKRYVTGIVHM